MTNHHVSSNKTFMKSPKNKKFVQTNSNKNKAIPYDQ